MISFLEGVVESATPLEVILNCQGVGYQVHVPVTTAETIPPAGQSVRLHIHPVYREDSQSLYGFASREERDFFNLVTSKVSGIGPKIGLNLMSRLSFQMLQDAIARGDAALLAKCPGIGKKTAERVCVELKDKVSPTGGGTATVTPASSGTVAVTPANAAHSDAVQALMTLGFKIDAADKAVRAATAELGDSASADALIKAALKTA